MTVKLDKKENSQVVLSFSVSAENFDKALDKAFKKVVKTVTAPGFRKGKMPRHLFEKNYGVESLYQEAIDIVLPEAYVAAVTEAGIDPVARPEIDVKQVGQGQDLEIEALVTVRPEVKLGDYKGLTVERLSTDVTDEDIETAVNDNVARLAELVVKEDAAALGDTVTIDFEGFLDGEAFEGGKGERYDLELGSGSFIPGFEDKLVGVKAGEDRDVIVTFPENYQAEHLAGKEVTFKTTTHEVKAKEVPALTDELAQELDAEVKTVAEYKEKVAKQLKDAKAQEAEQALQNSVIEQAVANAEVEVPSVMVEEEADRMVKEFEQRIAQQGLSLELYSQFTGQTEEELKAQISKDAETRVRTREVLAAIVEAEKIEVTEDEVEAEIQKIADSYNMPVEQIKAALGDVELLKSDIQLQKAIKLLTEEAK